jgi:hypothetical protein
MLAFDSLYPSSYAGAEYLHVSGTITAGRKTVSHEFPNKTFRYVEDLGENLRVFEINGVISGADYFAKKQKLITALNTVGINVLIHASEGIVNAVCTGYTVNEDLKETGVATFSMNFSEAEPNKFPVTTDLNAQTIANLAQELYQTISDFIANDFVINFIRNVSDAAQILSRLITTLTAISSIANSSSISKSDFNKKLSDFDGDRFVLPKQPDELASQMTDLISSFDGLSITDADRDNINNKLFGFGEETELPIGASEQIQERNRNELILNGSINALSLVNLYENAINFAYQDETQLDTKIRDLENKYQRLVFGNTNLISDDAANQLYDIRTEWRKYFENLRLTINKILLVTDVKPTTLRSFVYSYYWSDDNFDAIMSLNDFKNPARVSGDIKVLGR